MIRAPLAALSLLILAPACDSSDVGDGDQLIELSDEGRACVFAEAPSDPAFPEFPQDFAAGEPLFVNVLFADCESGCAGNIETSCEVTASGSDLTVTSAASYTVPTGEVICGDVCVVVAATCSIDGLADGTYAIAHGDGETSVTVPSQANEAPCVP